MEEIFVFPILQWGHFLLLFRDNFVGDLSDLRPGVLASWSYKKDPYNISIENTYIGIFNVEAMGTAHIVVRNSILTHFSPYACEPTIYMHAIDSTVEDIRLPVYDRTVEISDLKAGFHQYLKLSDHISGDSMPELILENTELMRGWYTGGYSDSNVTLDGVTLNRLVSMGENNNIKVYNSEIDELMLYAAPNTTIISKNSILKYWLQVYVPPNDATITGDLAISNDAVITSWVTPCTIKRNYPVVIKGQRGQAISGALLDLYNKNGILIWSGITDSEGNANFDVEYNDDNYSDTWNLKAMYNSEAKNENITLLTSTPIQFNNDDNGGDQGDGVSTVSAGGGGGGCFISTAAIN